MTDVLDPDKYDTPKSLEITITEWKCRWQTPPQDHLLTSEGFFLKVN